MIIVGTVAGDATVLADEQPIIPIVFIGRRCGEVVHLARSAEVLVAVGAVEWALQNQEPLRLEARLAHSRHGVVVVALDAVQDHDGDALLAEDWSELLQDADELSPLAAAAIRSARSTRRERGAHTMLIADLDERLVAPVLPPSGLELDDLLADLSNHPGSHMQLPTQRRWHIGPNGPTLAPCPPGTPMFSSRAAAYAAWREARPQIQRPEIRQPGG